MDELLILTKQFITDQLEFLIESEELTVKELEIIKLRYGVNCEKANLKKISKLTGIKVKNIKKEVLETERKLFNILKKKI